MNGAAPARGITSGRPSAASANGLAAARPHGAASIAEELFSRSAGSLSPTIFEGLPANGFALALGGPWPGVDTAPLAAEPGRALTPVRSDAPAGNDLFGIPIPPEAGQALLIVLMAFAAMCLVALLFANELELPARYRGWRTRWLRRF